jgi:hypothetical protein
MNYAGQAALRYRAPATRASAVLFCLLVPTAWVDQALAQAPPVVRAPAAPETMTAPAPPRYVRRFNTFAHRMLDLESEVSAVPDSKYELLDQILADAARSIVINPLESTPALPRTKALAVLLEIDRILAEHSVIYPPGDWIDTLGDGLEPHRLSDQDALAAISHAHTDRRKRLIREHQSEVFYYMDCDILSFMYMAIGEVIGFDLKLVETPHHNFVRYLLDEHDYIDWETTWPMETSDAVYSGPELTSLAVQERAYLATMTASETLGYFYLLRGKRWKDLKPPNLERAAADYRLAMQLYPQSSGPRNSLAWLYLSVPGFSVKKLDVVQLALRAVSIDPLDGEILDTLACAYAESCDFGKAVLFEREAIEKFRVHDPKSAGDKQEFQTRLQGFLQCKTYLQQAGHEPLRPPCPAVRPPCGEEPTRP